MGCTYCKPQVGYIDYEPLLLSRSTQWLNVAENDYPVPQPPLYRKHQMYPRKCYAHVDKFGLKIPKKYLNSGLKELAEHITRDCKTDIECARAIFCYITALNVKMILDTVETENPPEGSTHARLLELQTLSNNHAYLYRDLTKHIGIPCVVITGISKNSDYILGEKIDKDNIMSQWNAIYVDNQWRLVDTLWASICLIGQRSKEWMITNVDGEAVATQNEDTGIGEERQVRNDFYFLTDPDMFVCTHLPDDPDWQLLPNPIALQQFEEFVYIREQFFKLGMYLVPESHQNIHVYSKDGQIIITFGIPVHMTDKLEYSYLIFSKGRFGKQTKAMENTVMFEKLPNKIRYTISFPVTGEFRFDIFGHINNEKDKLDLVCSYILHCNEAMFGMAGLPDNPEIGWGPGNYVVKCGLVPLTHKQSIINVANGQEQVQFKMKKDVSVRARTKNLQYTEFDLERYVLVSTDKDILTIDIRLPHDGQYALKIYAKEGHDKGEMPNVCNYLLKANGENQRKDPYPQVKDAFAGRNIYIEKELGASLQNLKGGVLHTDDANLTFVVKSDIDTSLYADLQADTDSTENVKKQVNMSYKVGITTIDVSLKKPGRYALNIFATRTKFLPRIFKLHSYCIVYQSSNSVDGVSSKPNTNFTTISESVHDTSFPDNVNPVLAAYTQCTANDPLDNKSFTVNRENGVVSLSMPTFSDYALDMYVEQKPGILSPVGSKRFRRVEPDPEPPEQKPSSDPIASIEKAETRETPVFRQQSPVPSLQRRRVTLARVKLKLAIVTDSKRILKSTTEAFEASGLEDKEGLLKRSKRKLKHLELEEAIDRAMLSGSIYQLETALEAAESLKRHKKLDFRIVVARKMLHAKLKNKLKKKLTPVTIAELKSYQSPPKMVSNVLQAAFLLLGHDDSDIYQWSKLRIIMGDTQKLFARLRERALEDIPHENIQRAMELVKGVQRVQVKRTSDTADTFYSWVTNIIKIKSQANKSKMDTIHADEEENEESSPL